MAVIFKLSDAVAIGLHAAMFLALHEHCTTTARTIANAFKISEAHLVKILQALHRAGLVQSTRGPRGGYQLSRSADLIQLRELVEAIEGPIEVRQCLLHQPLCHGRDCVLGPLVQSINQQTFNYLQRHTVRDLSNAFQRAPCLPASAPSADSLPDQFKATQPATTSGHASI